MIRVIKHVNMLSFFKATVICLVPFVLAGCQPEGTGSVKGPAGRPDDSSLGRPLGNAPELKKKSNSAPESEQSKAANDLNPRL